ncbi:protocatechuate 4,5-dioxygenase subunit alpha [Sphingobium sp.]|uniref:protocatechuate 4,5-dioxygenase subunit alpha n=1 Tax=Sphingobium sp. TaxID=1912891 RepID=UPI003BB5DB5E
MITEDPRHQDIHEYLAELEDIPGTRIFTAKRARQGYHMNQFAMSLMTDESRARFKADERAYMDEWPLTEDQKQALLARDYNRCMELGGNVYFLSKLFSTDGIPFAEAVSTMTDMAFPEYREMMMRGGRSPEGLRSIKANAAARDATDKGAQ